MDENMIEEHNNIAPDLGCAEPNLIQPRDMKMDAHLNSNYIIEKKGRDDACLDVGLEAMAASQRAAFAELGAIGRVENEVCDASRDILKEVCDSGSNLRSAIDLNGRFEREAQDRNALFLAALIERKADRNEDATQASERSLFAAISANAREILKEQQCSTRDLLLQAASNAKDAALAAKDLECQAERNTAAIQLEAMRNKEELSKQIAECCCEQKALTLETSHKTQEVVRGAEERRLREELDRTREELLALRLRASLTPPLVGSVPL